MHITGRTMVHWFHLAAHHAVGCGELNDVQSCFFVQKEATKLGKGGVLIDNLVARVNPLVDLPLPLAWLLCDTRGRGTHLGTCHELFNGVLACFGSRTDVGIFWPLSERNIIWIYHSAGHGASSWCNLMKLHGRCCVDARCVRVHKGAAKPS